MAWNLKPSEGEGRRLKRASYGTGEEAEKWYDENTASPKTLATTASATSAERPAAHPLILNNLPT